MQEDRETPAAAGAEEKEAKFLCFTKELIPCKLLYFTLDAGFSSLFSFLGLYYTTSGLTVAQLGLMNGIGCGFALLAHPLWGAFIDTTIKYRTLVFILLNVSTTILEFGKPWVVIFFSKTLDDCMGNKTIVQSVLYSDGTNCTTHRTLLNQNTVFYAASVNCALSSIGVSGLTTYIEGVVVKTVFTRKTEHSYGKQKVFGPIGMAIGSLASGLAVDHYHPKHFSPYLAAFYIYLPLSLLQIPLLYILTKQAKWDYVSKKKEEQASGSAIYHLKDALKNNNNRMFLLTALISGTALYVYKHYLFLYMHAVKNPTKTIMALMSVARSISEFLVYPFSSRLIKLFGGRMRCIVTTMLASALCLAALSFATTPWVVLPLSILKGVSGALCWAALIEETWKIFPKEISNIAIGILIGFHRTIALIITNVFGGIVFHKFGGSTLFRSVAIINCLWCVVLIIYLGIRTDPNKLPTLPVTNCYDGNTDIEVEENFSVKDL